MSVWSILMLVMTETIGLMILVPVSYTHLNDLLTLYSVGDTCFAAGSTGTILKTNDGGITWVKLISNTSNNLYKMSFLNSQYGYVVGSGGVILKTTNGGNIWTTKIIGSSIYFRSVQCVDSLVAYAAGYTSGSNGNVAVIYKTSDGGLTWFQQTNIYSADYQLLYLPFNNSVKDESSNKLNVINHGGVLAPDRFGYANNAIRFNGTNQLLSIKDLSLIHI